MFRLLGWFGKPHSWKMHKMDKIDSLTVCRRIFVPEFFYRWRERSEKELEEIVKIRWEDHILITNSTQAWEQQSMFRYFPSSWDFATHSHSYVPTSACPLNLSYRRKWMQEILADSKPTYCFVDRVGDSFVLFRKVFDVSITRRIYHSVKQK